MKCDRDKVSNFDLISIITPAYRCAHVIDETIKSVIAQTYSNWEMLIAEDCSPDDTREVIENWTQIDSRIKLIKLDRNVGPAMARNAALDHARGRWIAFLDSDDLWTDQKLEKCLEFSHKYEAAFIYTGFRRINEAGGELGRYISVPATMNYRQLLGNTAIVTSTVMLDTAITGKISMRDTYYDDFDCWLQLLKRGITAWGINEDLLRYRLMEKSVSHNKLKSSLHVWRAYRNLENLNIFYSIWYFTQYALRGVLKYL